VNRGLRGGHAENQPTVPDINGRKSKNIAEEGAVRLGISAVEQEMSADNHAAKYIRIAAPGLTNFVAALKIE
jgi:hypothetical protein